MSKKSSRRQSSAVATIEPTQLDYRRQHGAVDLLPEPIADVHDNYGQPNKARGLYERLIAMGASDTMALAGARFRDRFELAALYPMRAADLEREVRSQGGTFGQVVEWARRERDDALDALGGPSSPAGLCAWFCLGEEQSLSQWAQREGWNQRPLSGHVAKGILLGALGVLEKFYDRGEKGA